MTENRIDYSGEEVYVGIDVHKNKYVITARCNRVRVLRHTHKASPESLVRFLQKRFEGATIFSAYEAGFSGFGLHRVLDNAAIRNIVVNPASIEIAANDRVKTDKRDSEKISEQLEFGKLKGIYVPTIEEELSRQLQRTRQQIVRNRGRVANQIKSKLHLFGLIPADEKKVVSNKYLRNIETRDLPEELKYCLGLLIEQWRGLTRQLLEVRSKMQEQAAKKPRLEEIYRSVPGVGPVTARILATELDDLSRFKNERSTFKHTGLTPGEYSSGETQRKGHISRQGSARLRAILVEAAWRAIKQDEALADVFARISAKRGKKIAIVAIARKLIGRMRACFANDTTYALGTVR